jgi:hypothetical protein
MINQDSITRKILVELSKEILSTAEIVVLLKNPKDFPKELIEKLSLETALKYWNGQNKLPRRRHDYEQYFHRLYT